MLLLCLPGAATHRPRQLWRQSSCREAFRPPSPSAHTPHTRPTSPMPLAHSLSHRHRQRGTTELLRCYHLVHCASSKVGASSTHSKRFAQVGSITSSGGAFAARQQKQPGGKPDGGGGLGPHDLVVSPNFITIRVPQGLSAPRPDLLGQTGSRRSAHPHRKRGRRRRNWARARNRSDSTAGHASCAHPV